METYTAIYVSDDLATAKKKIKAFEELFDQCITDGFIDLETGQSLGSIEVGKADKETVKSALEDITSKNSAELKKALKDKKTLILVEFQLSMDISPIEAAQWTYLFELYPDAVIVDAPDGEDVSFAKDLAPKYRKIQVIDLKNPSGESSEDDSPAEGATNAVFVDAIFEVLERIQENHEAVYAFKVFLSRAGERQKKLLESLLRRTVKNDKEGQVFLNLSDMEFPKFAMQLKKDLESLLNE